MKSKKITNAATVVLILVNVGLFAFIWLRYYNDYAFRSHDQEGAIGAIVVYYILYRWLSKLYRGYAIASTSIDETVLSQLISFGIADLALYVSCCLLSRNYVNVLPGLSIVVLQLLLTSLTIWRAKRYLMTHLKPDPTLLICGTGMEEEARRFTDRLKQKYSHLFDVQETISETQSAAEVEKRIAAADRVIFYGVSPEKRSRYIETCLDHNRVFFYVPEFADIVCSSCTVKNFLDTPMMRYEYAYSRNRNHMLKRTLDIVLSLLFILILSPVMLVTALCIKLEDGGPVFFRQERITRNNRPFNILKFRSMVPDAERRGVLPATEHDPRITKVGRIIRPTRIDELPQLLNILLGQMSFVGPRPECVAHVNLYNQEVPEFKYRLRVKGGLTGYAQVYGKYNTSPEDKLKLDMLYIENQSFLLDFKLFMLTIKTMFQREATEGFDTSRSQAINRAAAEGQAHREEE